MLLFFSFSFFCSFCICFWIFSCFVNSGVDIDVNDDAEEEQVKLPKLDLIMYTADELIELRTAVMSQTWPSYLDEAFKNNRGSWDPDRWHQNKKRGSTPPPSEGDKISEKGDRTKKDETNEAGINKVSQLTDI